ncbi:MAG: hypothetical protein IJF45_03985 [Clostridia bacterium]|nr:hypothetical protein [Clostridia bacterium]
MIKALIHKYRTQLGDSAWSILGLVLMNAVAQIAVYPFLGRSLGEVGYGDMLYLMAYINIVTVSVGCAANLARMTASAEERERNNGDYHLFLLLVCALGIPFCLLIRKFGGVQMDDLTTLSYYLLFVMMAFRYYADVAYKITLNYKRYFLYYLSISIGYAIGTVLVWKTGTNAWPLAILPGEALGVLFAFAWGKTLRARALRPSARMRHVWRVIAIFCVSEGITQLIFNADRLLLQFLIGSTAVTAYYLATLVGKTVSLVSTPLNSVLIGYLVRYDGSLTRRMMKWIVLGSLVAFAVLTGVCLVGGYILLLWLYPDQLATVGLPLLLMGSLAQVIFFTTGILTVILIRFAKQAYQVYINGFYGLCFFGVGIPAALLGGVWGFSLAMVGINFARWLLAVFLGWRWAHISERAAAHGSELHE